MNRHGVRFLLIGGMNFMLRHEPVLTFDIDLWIEDTEANRRNCETAIVELETTWGPTDDTWQPVVVVVEPAYCLRSCMSAAYPRLSELLRI